MGVNRLTGMNSAAISIATQSDMDKIADRAEVVGAGRAGRVVWAVIWEASLMDRSRSEIAELASLAGQHGAGCGRENRIVAVPDPSSIRC